MAASTNFHTSDTAVKAESNRTLRSRRKAPAASAKLIMPKSSASTRLKRGRSAATSAAITTRPIAGSRAPLKRSSAARTTALDGQKIALPSGITVSMPSSAPAKYNAPISARCATFIPAV